MNKFIGRLSVFTAGVAAAITAPASDSPASAGPAEKKTDEQGHVLVSFWKEYKAASDADKPQTQQNVLEKILTESKSNGYIWDYACGAVEWYRVTVSRNWKVREESAQRIQTDVKDIDNPLLTYCMKHSGIVGLSGAIDAGWFRSNVAERSGELRKSCNSGFYEDGLDPQVHPFVIASVSNDYEFLLWSVWSGGVSDEVSVMAQELLEAEVADYPYGAYIEFRRLITDNPLNVNDSEKVSKRIAALTAFSEKYAGKAIALLSDQQILIDRMECLTAGDEIAFRLFEDDYEEDDYEEDDYEEDDYEEDVSEEDFKALRAECDELVNRRKSFSGQEAVIAADVDDVNKLMECLDNKSINVSVKDDEATVLMQNVDQVKLVVTRGGKTVHEAEVINPIGSYYCIDTVKCALPALQDGTYEIKCTSGKLSSKADYDLISISAAYRTIDAGVGVYIADYKSGKPINRADLEISYNGSMVRTEKDFCFNGFTSIQEILDGCLAGASRKRFVLKCSYIDENGLYRESDELSFTVYADGTVASEPMVNECGRIFLDRAAFNPGDTLRFKAIAYNSLSGKEFTVVEEGRELSLSLTDPDDNVVQSVSLKTNDFGSVSGNMFIPEDAKGGTYALTLRDGKTRLTDARLTVDEFVLPTFELAFDPTKTAYFGGDTVSVKGKLSSYSGHSLSSAKVAYEIYSYFKEARTVSGNLEAASDGSFDIRFVADSTDVTVSYYVTVRVTDLTGETLQWSKTVRVNPSSSLKIGLTGTAEGDLLISGKNPGCKIMQGDGVQARFNVNVGGLDVQPEISVRYFVRKWSAGASEGDAVLSGTAVLGREISVDLAGSPSGLYLLKAEAEYISESGHAVSLESSVVLLKTSEDDEAMVPGVEYFFKKADDGRVAVQVETCDSVRWLVVEVYGPERQLLHSEVLSIGTESKAVTFLDYGYDRLWPDQVQLVLFSFKDSGVRRQSFMFKGRSRPDYSLPLSFTRFTDKSLPQTGCEFAMQTDPGVEAVVSVFDKSTERIRANRWSAVSRSANTFFTVDISARTGSRTSGSVYFWRQTFDARDWTLNIGHTMYGDDFLYDGDSMSIGMVPMSSPRLMARSMGANLEEEKVVMDSMEEAEFDDVDVVQKNASGTGSDDGPEVAVREQFDNTLVFLPCLRSDASGRIEFSVTPTDKLSTYYVSVFAHDAGMRSNVIRQEMVVSVPVKVSVALPQFLYCGDNYKLKAAVSNVGEEARIGVLSVEVYDTEDYKGTAPIMNYLQQLDVEAGGAAQAEFEIDVPEDISVLGVKVSFVSGNVTDAVFETVPVYQTVQTLTEAHSALLLSGMDADSLRASLAAQFAGESAEVILAALDGQSAVGTEDAFAVPAETKFSYKEVSLKNLALEAIPQKVSTEKVDVLSLSEALYVGLLARSLPASRTASRSGISTIPEGSDTVASAGFNSAALIEKIIACRNADGGFGWYEGFNSSPILTAVVLERLAGLRDRGLLDPDAAGLAPEAAVKYLDNNKIPAEYPIWCGGLSLEQYLYVRSMYTDIELSSGTPTNMSRSDCKKQISEFRTKVKEYLLPKEKRGLEGEILSKARRVAVSLALSKSSVLCSSLGLGTASGKLQKSAAADMASLTEYAVEHSSGGIYYPNAVMPFRGLLESEAYAHSLLCDLCEDYFQRTSDEEYHRIAEGIRLWLMVQKETQHWDDDPAYVNAISSVLDGSQEVLSSKVAILTKQYSSPFCEIAAASNGFTVERKFYRYTTTDGKIVRTEIHDGDTLSLGESIVAEYRIWSEENRSFVQLEAPRYAAVRPVNQLSGRQGGLLRVVPVASIGFYFTPASYREVKSDRTFWHFDVCPEETTVLTEESFVTQSGTFSSPAVTIESLYAPHYRANDSAAPPLAVN